MRAKITGRATKNRRIFLFRYRVVCPCMYCGKFLIKENATIEHLIRRCDDGRNTRGNLYVSCGECNHNRDDTSVIDWKYIRSQGKVIPDLIIFIECGDKVVHHSF